MRNIHQTPSKSMVETFRSSGKETPALSELKTPSGLVPHAQLLAWDRLWMLLLQMPTHSMKLLMPQGVTEETGD